MWCVAAAWTVGALFMIAAVGKAMSPVQFGAVVGHVLRQLHMPALPVMGVAFVLISIEAFLGVCFLLLKPARWVVGLTFVLVVCFCAVLMRMWLSPPAGGCGCLGFFSKGMNTRAQVALGFARNIGIAMCVWSLISPTAKRDGDVAKSASPGRAAFTIIEVLVVILVVSIVIALVLPAMGKTRERSRRIVELNQTRHIGIALQAYVNEYRESFPYFATRGSLTGPLVLRGVELSPLSYFNSQATLYLNLLYPAYLSSNTGLDIDAPGSHGIPGWPAEIFRTSVLLTYTAFSRPSYWSTTEIPNNEQDLQPGVVADVRFPSQKGLVLDLRAHNRLAHSQRDIARYPWGVLWADGSATAIACDLERTYDTVTRPGAMFDWPVLATRDGLAGRDFQTAP